MDNPTPSLTDNELRAIAEAATPGPWFPGRPIVSDSDGEMLIVSVGPQDLSDRPNKSHHYEDTLLEVWSNPNDVDDDGERAIANARHIATFDPPTIIALLDRLAAHEAERAADKARIAELERAGETLRREAFLQLQNSEGCAANHYGGDCNQFGMPQWLIDSRFRIETAATVIERTGA